MEFNQKEHEHPPTAENLSPDREQSQQRPPVYMRDRHGEPVRINADDESSFKLCIYFVAFVLPILLFVLIAAFALPSATVAINPNDSLVGTNLQNCSSLVRKSYTSPNTLTCYTNKTFATNAANSMGIYVKLFSNLNQFMLFYIDVTPYAEAQTNKNAQFNQYITFSIYAASYSSQSKQTTLVGALHSENITIDSKIYQLAQRKIFLGYQSRIARGQQFFVQFVFQNGSAITKSSDFYLYVETVRENFTIYTILLRVAFFVLTLAVLVLYTKRLLKIPKRKLSIEQKGVQIIAGFTLLFNDQLYFVTVLWPNPVSSFLSALFIWTYLFGLYTLWVCFLLRIINEQPDTETIELKKPLRIVLLIVFFLIGLTFCAGYGIIQSGEYPMISINDIDYMWFRVYLAFILICLVIALLYLMWLYVTVCHNKPLRAHRHNVFMMISVIYILMIVLVTLLGSFKVFNFSGGLIFFTFAFANSYSYFLMYLYSPTQDQLSSYREGDYELRTSQSQSLQEAKTIDIELLQEESAKSSAQKLMEIDLENSKNSEQNDKKSDLSIRRRKRKLSKHQKTEELKNNETETHKRMMKSQQAHQRHKDISIDEQRNGDGF